MVESYGNYQQIDMDDYDAKMDYIYVLNGSIEVTMDLQATHQEVMNTGFAMSFKDNRVRRSASRKVVRETSFDGDIHNYSGIKLKKLESDHEDKKSGSLQAESISDSSAGSYKK